MTNGRGEEVPGRRKAILCRDCDAQDPDAVQLLALFAVDGEVNEANEQVFHDLVERWVQAVGARTVDPEKLANEEELWRRGEL